MSKIGSNNVNPLSNKPWFLCVFKSLENTVGKEKFLVTSNFFYSHNVFYLFGELSAIFINLKKSHLKTFAIWKSLKFVVWKRVKGSLILHSRHFERMSQLSENENILATSYLMELYQLQNHVKF